MTSSQKRKKADTQAEPHTEKSTMTEPQEEFIEEKGRPSRAGNPSELRRGQKETEKEEKQGEK